MRNKAIFFDRDGVINIDKDHLYKIENFEFYPDVFESLKKIPKDFKIIIVTNQAGIAKGLYTEKDFEILNDWMLNEFKTNNIKIDKVYFCPHHKEAKIEKYRIDCECRKPKAGMLFQAEKDFDLDLKSSWLIGDKMSDIKAGQDAGTKAILVKIGHTNNGLQADYTVDNLTEAIDIIQA